MGAIIRAWTDMTKGLGAIERLLLKIWLVMASVTFLAGIVSIVLTILR